MWNHIIGRVTTQLRPFNDKLIYGWKENISRIPEYFDKMFRQVVVFFDGKMTYKGYREMSPVERIQYILDNQIIRGSVNIRRTETTLYQFEFEFRDRPYYAYIPVPYLINEKVIYNDTDYYPQFQIVEKGGVNRTETGTVIVKVMRLPITFGRRPGDKQKLTAMSGKVYIDQLITAKIHMSKSVGADIDKLPLVLYHFCKYGYPQTMRWYHMEPDDIQLAQTYNPEDTEHEYFSLSGSTQYMKVRKSILTDFYKLRMVISLYLIWAQIPMFTAADVFGDDTSYYLTVLGKYTSSKDTPTLNKLLLPNALRHIKMTDPMLDLVAQSALESVGCKVNNVYELLYWMYYNIDDLMVSYDPTDLYDKKLESLDQLAGLVVRKVVLAQYDIINSKKSTLEPKTVEQFCKKCSPRENWIASGDNERQAKVFRANPALYNDCALFITLKRILSLESVASGGGRRRKGKAKKGGGKNKANPLLLRAHPSMLTVTSLLDIPASSPIVTGSMNPYCEFDEDGNIIKPPYADEIKDVFK